MLRLAPVDRGVLPRWGINSPIRDHGADPGAYSGTVGWTSRHDYLTRTVPAAIAARPEVLAAHHVEADTFLRWVTVKSLYAQEQRSGRTVIVRPMTVRGLMQCGLSTVYRCQRIARDLELEVVITPGRMLSELEVHRARKKGSPQRGLSTVSAFVVPAWLPRPVEHDTPSSGLSISGFVTDIRTFKGRYAGPKGAPLRSAPHQRRKSPGWPLALELTKLAIFLHRCPPGRLAGQLSPFQTAPHPWRAVQILRAMDTVNVRHGYTAPVRAKTTPWGLLAWYLDRIDPVGDHPSFGAATPTRRGGS